MKRPNKFLAILLIAILILILCFAFFVIRTPNAVLKYWWVISNKDVEFILDKTVEDDEYPIWWDNPDRLRHRILEALLIIGNEPVHLKALRDRASEDTYKGRVAALVLFLLGHDQEEMFEMVFNPSSSDKAVDELLGTMFKGKIDLEKYASYRGQLISDFENCVNSVQMLRMHALWEFAQFEDVVDFLIEQTGNEDPDIRKEAFIYLRFDDRAENRGPVNDKVTAFLEGVIKDSVNSAEDRDIALSILSTYGWTEEIEAIITDKFTSGGIEEKRTALAAISSIDRPDIGYRLLYPGVFDPDPEVSMYSLRMNFVLFVLAHPWVFYAVMYAIPILLSLMMMKIMEKSRKSKDLNNETQPDENS